MTTSMIFAVSIFTYFSAIGLLFSTFWSIKSEGAYKMLSMAAGFDLQKTAATSEETGKAMNFLLIDFTSQMLGLNLFALFILWLPFRAGEQWAWIVLWFYPLMFAWHYLHYAKKTRFSMVQIVYCLLSSAALLLTYTHFF
ncbi:MAG: hypothetical protein WAT91_15840 [Saprospiraceae bacterium]